MTSPITDLDCTVCTTSVEAGVAGVLRQGGELRTAMGGVKLFHFLPGVGHPYNQVTILRGCHYLMVIQSKGSVTLMNIKYAEVV